MPGSRKCFQKEGAGQHQGLEEEVVRLAQDGEAATGFCKKEVMSQVRNQTVVG